MDNLELDELYERKLILEERKASFFDGISSPNYGDRGYQEILEELDEIYELLNED